ncbi:alpha/beta hydrolase [Lentzea indica]|uniref:alpha/beta hydrolase n=1 Tax=Lentzea indica TaxID=2604800 RepID=UPI0028A8C98A|nr:alpha/beta hydrolase [Lentzea indica]
MRVRKVFAVLGTLLALAASVPSGAGAAEETGKPGTKKPTIVLVHGAFADGASWNGVVERLQRKGFPVVAVANPLRSLTGDANYLRKVLASIEGPIILAGHSYGGMVQSQAALGNPNVKALVYVAAFAPEKGESALELSNKFPGSTLGDTLQTIDIGDGTKDLVIQQDKYWQQFAADVSRKDATLAAATQRPVNDTALTEKAEEPRAHRPLVLRGRGQGQEHPDRVAEVDGRARPRTRGRRGAGRLALGGGVSAGDRGRPDRPRGALGEAESRGAAGAPRLSPCSRSKAWRPCSRAATGSAPCRDRSRRRSRTSAVHS